jgi:Ca2+-transporting ATPase
VKGAVERLLKHCTKYNEFGLSKPLTTKKEDEILSQAYEMGRQGLRVLGLAKGPTFQDLVFIGIVGMQDPPRPNVRECIQLLVASGVQVKMLTGDAQETAVSIATMVGMDTLHTSCLSGTEMDKMDERMLEKVIPQVSVFYRVAPKHKLMIVKVGGHFLYYMRYASVVGLIIVFYCDASRHFRTKASSLGCQGMV